MSDPVRDFYDGVYSNVRRGADRDHAGSVDDATSQVSIGGDDNNKNINVIQPESELGLGAALVRDKSGDPIYAAVTTDGRTGDGGGRVLTPLLQRDDGSHYVVALDGTEVTVPPNAATKGFDGVQVGPNHIGTLASRTGDGEFTKLDASVDPFKGGVKAFDPLDISRDAALQHVRSENRDDHTFDPVGRLTDPKARARAVDRDFLNANRSGDVVTSMRKALGSPASFTGDVANAAASKMLELSDTAKTYQRHEHDLREGIMVMKVRVDAYNRAYTELQMHITAAKTAITTSAASPTAQTQAAGRFRELEAALNQLRTNFRDEMGRIQDRTRTAFAAYKKAGNPDFIGNTKRRGADDTPKEKADGPAGPTDSPPVVAAPSSPSTSGPSTSSPGPGTSPSSTTSPSTSTTGDSPTSTKTSPQDMLSKILAGGTPVGGNPVTNPTAGINPALAGMAGLRPQGGVPMTGAPQGPGMVAGGPTPMTDSALDKLLGGLKPGSGPAPSPSTPSSSVSGSGGLPQLGSTGTSSGNGPSGSGPKQPPTANLSTLGTRVTGGVSPTVPSSEPGGPAQRTMPMGGSPMPMPMGGAPGGGGAGGSGGAKRETGLRPETGVENVLGRPVTTTTPVVNDRKNRAFADELPPADTEPRDAPVRT